MQHHVAMPPLSSLQPGSSSNATSPQGPAPAHQQTLPSTHSSPGSPECALDFKGSQQEASSRIVYARTVIGVLEGQLDSEAPNQHENMAAIIAGCVAVVHQGKAQVHFNSSSAVYFFLFHFLLPSPFSKPCNEDVNQGTESGNQQQCKQNQA